MQQNEKKIPTLAPERLSDFHSKQIGWHPVISDTKHSFFHVNRVEDYLDKMKFPLPPHRKTVYDFIFLTKGYSIRSKGLNSFQFNKGEIFFLPALQITQHEIISADAEGFFCHFDEKIFQILPKSFLENNFPFLGLQANPIVKLDLESKKQAISILERLLAIYTDESILDTTLIASYLLSLFGEAKRNLPTEQKKNKNSATQITEQYKNALVQYIYEKQTITDYADLLNVSPNYLNKCVKAAVNKTAQELLSEMVILEAKTLLKYSNLQIAEIAYRLCDQSPSNFTRFFKHYTGLTPREFIEKD